MRTYKNPKYPRPGYRLSKEEIAAYHRLHEKNDLVLEKADALYVDGFEAQGNNARDILDAIREEAEVTVHPMGTPLLWAVGSRRVRRIESKDESSRYNRRTQGNPNKTATKKKFLALVDKLGATVEFNMGGGVDSSSIDVLAPRGYVWGAIDAHELIAWAGYGETIPRGELYASLIDDMEFGLERCEDPECEWCVPVEENPNKFQRGTYKTKIGLKWHKEADGYADRTGRKRYKHFTEWNGVRFEIGATGEALGGGYIGRKGASGITWRGIVQPLTENAKKTLADIFGYEGDLYLFGTPRRTINDVKRGFEKFIVDHLTPIKENPGKSYEQRAINEYGLTDNWRAAGFILADGSLLDLSEGSGSRVADHRVVCYYTQGKVRERCEQGERWPALERWCRVTGAIRFMPESPSFDIFEMPTREQLRRIREIVESTDREFGAEFNGEYRQVGGDFYMPYEWASFINDLFRYFDE